MTGPRTGAAADADPGHRQAVRLVSVTAGVDELYDQPLVEVTWADEDALAFEVCVSTHGGPQCQLISDVSVARGNVLLADHGRSITFCGFAPQTFAVPPADVTVTPCGPPAFGCPDRQDESPAVAFIHALLTRSRAGQTLSADDIAQLGALAGTAAVARADLTADVAVPGQTAALEALLAQLSYPPVLTRFRPVLSYAPVTQQTAYPAPDLVSAAQAALLAGIEGRAQARVTELWRAARDGAALTSDQTAELVTLFGQATLDRVAADGPASRRAARAAGPVRRAARGQADPPRHAHRLGGGRPGSGWRRHLGDQVQLGRPLRHRARPRRPGARRPSRARARPESARGVACGPGRRVHDDQPR